LRRRPGWFTVATRRGKQFNSMVHESRDALNDAVRDAVLISAEDAAELGISDRDPIRLRSDDGEFLGRAFLAPVRPGNLQVHWPEGETLLNRGRRSPQAGIPDYNAEVQVLPVDATGARE
jgi:anaerobic selenocysteine-containing dehydrogenase